MSTGHDAQALEEDADNNNNNDDDATSRRRFLRIGGMSAAAAAAVAASGALGATRADAAAGDTIKVDQSFTGAGTTQLTDSQLKVVIDNGGRVAILGQNLTTVQSGPGNGVQGDGIVGVVGSTSATNGGVGVQGNGSRGTGVLGVGTASATSAAVGVHGQAAGSSTADAVFAENTVGGRALHAKSSTGPVAFLEQTTPPAAIPPTSGTWAAGTVLVKGGHLFYCYHSGTGTASRWVKMSSNLVLLNPAKPAYDSRNGGGILANGATRTFALTGAGLPSGAGGALVNISVVNTVGRGSLTVFAGGYAFPTNCPNIWWFANGQTLGCSATTKVNGLGQISVRCTGAGASTHFFASLVGYYP